MSLPPYLDPRMPAGEDSIGWDDATREFPTAKSAPDDEVAPAIAEPDADDAVAPAADDEVAPPAAEPDAPEPVSLSPEGTALERTSPAASPAEPGVTEPVAPEPTAPEPVAPEDPDFAAPVAHMPASYPPQPPAPIEHPANERHIDSILSADDPAYQPVGEDSPTHAFESPYDSRNLAIRPPADAPTPAGQPTDAAELERDTATLQAGAANAMGAASAGLTAGAADSPTTSEQDPTAGAADSPTPGENLPAATGEVAATAATAATAGIVSLPLPTGPAAGATSAATSSDQDGAQPATLDSVLDPIPPAPTKAGIGRHLLGVLVGLLLTPVGIWLWLWGTSLLAPSIARAQTELDPFGLGLVVVGGLALGVVALLGTWSPAVPLTGGLVWGVGAGLAILISPAGTRALFSSLTGGQSWAFLTDYWSAGVRGNLLVCGLVLAGAGLAAALARRSGRLYGQALTRYTLRSGREQ